MLPCKVAGFVSKAGFSSNWARRNSSGPNQNTEQSAGTFRRAHDVLGSSQGRLVQDFSLSIRSQIDPNRWFNKPETHFWVEALWRHRVQLDTGTVSPPVRGCKVQKGESRSSITAPPSSPRLGIQTEVFFNRTVLFCITVCSLMPAFSTWQISRG